MYLLPLSLPPGERGKNGEREGGRREGWGEESREGKEREEGTEEGRRKAYFSNGDFSSLCHGCIKVSGRLSEDEISSLVCLPCLDESKVRKDGFLHDVVVAIEYTVFLPSALNLHMVIVVKSDWFSLVYKRPKASRCVEGRNSRTPSTNTLDKRTLEQEGS